MPTSCKAKADCESAFPSADVVCVHSVCRCSGVEAYPDCECTANQRPDSGVRTDAECWTDFCNFNLHTGECGGGVCELSDQQFHCTSCGNNGNVQIGCQCFEDQTMKDGVCQAATNSISGIVWASIFIGVILIAILSLWLYMKYGKAARDMAQQEGVVMDVVRKDEKEGLVKNSDTLQNE